MITRQLKTITRLTGIKWKGIVLYNNAPKILILDFLEPQKVGTEKLNNTILVNDRISGIVQSKLGSNPIQSIIYVGIWNGLGYDIQIDNLANISNLTTSIRIKQYSLHIEGFGRKQNKVIFKPC